MRMNIETEITCGTPYGWEQIEGGLEITSEEVKNDEITN